MDNAYQALGVSPKPILHILPRKVRGIKILTYTVNAALDLTALDYLVSALSFPSKSLRVSHL